MPNWCDNTLYIESDEKTIKELKEAIEKDELLNYLVPMPKELENTTAPSDTPNWYWWRVEEWGTKWEVKPEIAEDTSTSIQMYFQSAWGPPLEAYNTFHDQCIEKDIPIEIRATYIEWGMMFCGLWENGDDSHYQIPEDIEEAKLLPEDILDEFQIIEELEMWAELDGEEDYAIV